MPVVNDWDIDYVNKIFSHVDGVLTYDTNTGTAPAIGDFIRGTNSGAIGRIIAGSDLGGTAATGSVTLTDVQGLFDDNDPLEVLSTVAFDTIANGGFVVGDQLDGPTTEEIDVRHIDFNIGATTSEGIVFGDGLVTGFANNEQLDINGGVAAVAIVATNAETDNSGLFSTALADGTLAVPGTASENDSVLIHYDGGTITIPDDAQVSDATSGAIGFAQKVYGGSQVEGTIRVIDSDTTGGAWTDDNVLDIELVLNYDNQVAGQVFQVDDIIAGTVSLRQARVLQVEDLGGSTGRLVLADETGTTAWDSATPDLVQVTRRGGLPITPVTIADVADTTHVIAAAVLNLPFSERTEQRVDQGGIYDDGDSLNIVRSFNSWYTYIANEFDELGQLDDDYPVRADVKNQVYVGQNNWQIRDLSLRFLEKGSWADQSADNVFTNFQSVLAAADISTHAFLYDATNPVPQPDLYAVQNSAVVPQAWLEGEIDVLIKVKTNTDVAIIDDTVPALGQLINGGQVDWNIRPYSRTYDYFTLTTVGGVAVVPMANAIDAANTTGQYEIDWDTGSGATIVVGETFRTNVAAGNALKRGIIVTQEGDAGATGTASYILKEGAGQFANGEVLVGDISGKLFTVNEPTSIGDLVSGYGVDVETAVVTLRLTGGTVASGPFILGEPISQAVSGATGIFMEDDSDNIYIEEDSGSATFDTTNIVTGGTSAATYTPAATNLQATVPKDLGDGSGDHTYDGIISGNLADTTARTIAVVHEWTKFLTRKEADATVYTFATPGLDGKLAANRVDGNQFQRLETGFALVRSSGGPLGQKPGDVMLVAQGWFLDKDFVATADLQNMQLIDNAGNTVNPPNLQIIELISLISGDRGSAYRTTGAASLTILRREFEVGAVGGSDNQAADNDILVQVGDRSVSPLPNDIPLTGVLRVEDPSNPGIYLIFNYNAVDRTNNRFTLTAGTIGDITGGSDLTQTDDVAVGFFEEETGGTSISNTVQYVGDIPLLFRFRLKGFKPFETTGTFTTTGASQGAIRDPDPTVNLP